MPRTLRLLLLPLLLTAWSLGPAAGRAWAETPAEAGARLRSTLPEPSPAHALDYEGDVVLDGVWAGEIQLTLRAAKMGPEAVWRMTEKTFLDWKGTEVRTNTILHLARDLSVISGSSEQKIEDRTVALMISRSPTGFVVQRRVQQGEDWQEPEMLEMSAPPGTSHGIVPLVHLLRAVPAEGKGRYALARVDAWPYHAEPQRVEVATITSGAKGTLGRAPHVHTTWAVKLEVDGGDPITLHLAADRRTLLGGQRTKGGAAMEIVPRGEGGVREKLTDTQPADTWKAAFLKFGYGYHMARRELLEAAFHWDRMYEHETTVLKRWPADKPLEEFKAAWIDEFCANSLHRSESNTKRLLDMTLATGKVTEESADHVVFAAHANFGGGTQRTYRLERRKGVWGIVRMDF